MSWKRYEKYQDSGVEWLGEIPEGWGVKPLKYLSKEPLKYGANESAEDEDPHSPRFIRITDINSDGTLKKDTYKSLPETIARDFLLQDGDILFARSGATVGKTFIYSNSWGRCCFAGYLVRFRSNKEQIDPKYLSLYSNSISYWDWISSVNIQSTIQNVSGEKYANHNIPLPPLHEQYIIAAFLDRETTRIDALIEKKERLITLLEEKRAGLISHAVTKGLDPSVPMKDSGVEWIGMVPAGWDNWKISHSFKIIGSGTTPKSDDLSYYDGDIPWVTTSELRETEILDTNSKITKKAIQDYSILKFYPPGTLLFAMYGATIGRLGILGISATVNQACCAFSHSEIIHTKFLFYWLLMRKPILVVLSSGGGQPNLNQEKLREIRVPIPPFPEQVTIAAFLDHETARIDALIEKINDSIEKLHEYRSALISAAVTGKIDLRQEAMG